MSRAVFLDRDGVLIEDAGLVVKPEQLKLLPGAVEALRDLHRAELKLVVISNQAVVARGLINYAEAAEINGRLGKLLDAAGAPTLDGWYFCPHHPKATLEAYRLDCDCRKPKPGLLLQAARELGLELPASFMIGDRITDVIAGSRAGCRTVLVQTGRHIDPPIETSAPLDLTIQPDYTCADLRAAAEWVLEQCRIEIAE
jgi:D-glycero-D-manno-heptose 1,7-bisphosphate phosphatase